MGFGRTWGKGALPTILWGEDWGVTKGHPRVRGEEAVCVKYLSVLSLCFLQTIILQPIPFMGFPERDQLPSSCLPGFPPEMPRPELPGEKVPAWPPPPRLPLLLAGLDSPPAPEAAAGRGQP